MLRKLLVVLLLNLALFNYADEPNSQSLVQIAMARNLFEQKNYGESLTIAQQTWLSQPNCEASFLIGQIYEAQSEYLLAVKHYERALDEDKTYKYRPKYIYALANSYYYTKQNDKRTQVLESIVKDTFPRNNYDSFVSQKKSATRLLLKDGLSHVFKLYRWDDNYAIKAIELLSFDAYEKNNNEDDALSALEGFLYVFLSKTNTIYNRLSYYKPGFEFTTISNLIENALQYNEIVDYMEASNYFGSYYFLACAIYNYNQASQSKVLFNHLRQLSEAGHWATKAQKQFENPFMDTSFKID